MANPPGNPLAPHEMLRVMDAAQVIHKRQAALEEHEAFDREATIREIQLMYEELGDLVDSRTIERALDEYLSQRYAFRPATPGLGRSLALLYIRRGRVARRVLLPAAALATVAWGGFQVAEMAERRSIEREAEARVATQRWLVSLEADVARLHAAVVEAATEDEALQRATALQAAAATQLAAGDADGLGETAGRYEDLHTLVAAECEIVVTGGVWRYSNDDPDIRNHYLLVQALDSNGQPVPFPIRSEETGATRTVSTWGERVPKDVYDRVGADKQDNGIIDDEEFGFKPRGFITADRRYPDVGQITEW